MARLILNFLRQRNFKALKMLSKQLRMPGRNMLKTAKETVEKAPIDRHYWAERVEKIRRNPEASKNFLGNMQRVMDENVKKYKK